MHQNSSLLETEYLRTNTSFIRECRKRNLIINKEFLKKCKEWNLFRPVLTTKEGVELYDTYQIPLVARIYKKAKTFTELEENLELIKGSLFDIETVLPLLYKIRYYYQDELSNIQSAGVLPPFKLTKKQAQTYSNNFEEIYEEALKTYEPAQYLKDSGLTEEDIINIRDRIFIAGHIIDPIDRWYPFIRTVRQNDYQKFKKIEKEVLLAHDYYILAEILTYFYRQATGKKALDPEDIFDGRGGKWKIKNCELCKKEIKVKNIQEKYCTTCKKKIAREQGVTYKCYKCEKPFYKYIDGDEMINKPFSAKKKKGVSKEAEVTTLVKVQYGRTVIYTQCDCGALNFQILEKGWF